MSQCKDITLEKLKVRCSGLDSYFPGTRNIDKHPVWGGWEVLSSVKTWPLKTSQMHCSVPVTAIMLGRTVQSSELWVMCQWWGIFNHTLPWSSSSEPGHLQVHQDPSRLIPELLLQHEFDSPEEGLHQLRKESLERDKGTMYLLIQWSFNTSLQPFNTSYAYALRQVTWKCEQQIRPCAQHALMDEPDTPRFFYNWLVCVCASQSEP